MPTLEVNQSPLSAAAPTFVPYSQSKSNRTNATDGDVNGSGRVGCSGSDIVPVPWTSIIASGDRRNGSSTDDHHDNLGRPLPALRKAKMYSSSNVRGSGGLDGFGGVVDGSNIDDEENASPVPPSTKKSRIGTIKVTVTGGGLSPMTSSMPALIATTKKKRAGEKRVTISDDGNGNGIGYINGVATGDVSSSSGNTGGGPGFKCFDVVDLNTKKKKKSPSLGKYKKTPGPYKSAIALLDALDLSSPEKSPSTAPDFSKKSSSLSFRRTPGAGREKTSLSATASTSTPVNLSRKRLLSTLSIADDDSEGGSVSIGGGDNGGRGADFASTPAERAKSRSFAKAASSATKTKLLQKAKDSGVLDAASNAKSDGPIPIILSAQSSNGTYLGSNVTIALEGRLQSLTIDGLGDKMGTYRASNQSGLCLHLDRDPIDRILFGSASLLAYQPLNKTSAATNDSTLTIDDDEDTTTVGTIGTIGTVGEHSWRQDISRSPLRAFTITSSDEKKLLSEPLRAANDVYDDNSLIVWTKEEDAGTVLSDDSTVSYDVPQEDPFDGDYEYNGLEDDDEESKKGGGQDDEYLADSEGHYDEMGTGLTDTSLGGNDNLSGLMPNVMQRGKADKGEDPDSSATLGVSNLSERLLGGPDEDEASDDGNAAAATILLSDGDGASGNGAVGTVGTSSKVTTGTDIATQHDDSALHMRSFLAGVATLFLAQVGMAFLGFSFLLIKSFIG